MFAPRTHTGVVTLGPAAVAGRVVDGVETVADTAETAVLPVTGPRPVRLLHLLLLLRRVTQVADTAVPTTCNNHIITLISVSRRQICNAILKSNNE